METPPSYSPKHLLLSEQLHPKDWPLASTTQGIRAGVSQELPEEHGLQTTLAHRAGLWFSCAGQYLEFQLPISEESQLVLPLQVVPIQMSQVHLWREQGIKAALRGTGTPAPLAPIAPMPSPRAPAPW